MVSESSERICIYEDPQKYLEISINYNNPKQSQKSHRITKLFWAHSFSEEFKKNP